MAHTRTPPEHHSQGREPPLNRGALLDYIDRTRSRMPALGFRSADDPLYYLRNLITSGRFDCKAEPAVAGWKIAQDLRLLADELEAAAPRQPSPPATTEVREKHCGPYRISITGRL